MKLREWLWAPILIAAAILSGLFTAPSAHADAVDDAVATYGVPVVCETLDEYPSADGVFGVALAFYGQGYTPEQSGEIVARSVIVFCPEHFGAVRAFINEYGSKGRLA